MPFPFSAQGTILFNGGNDFDLNQVTLCIEDALRNVEPSNIVRSGNVITFRTGFAQLTTNWSKLSGITSGEISAAKNNQQIAINFKISFTHLLMVISTIIPLLYLGAKGISAGYFILAWIWLFGGNYAIALFRFRRLIKAAALKAHSSGAMELPPKSPNQPLE